MATLVFVAVPRTLSPPIVTTMTRPRVRPLTSVLWAALVASVLFTLCTFDSGFLSGRGPYWEHLQLWDLDRAQALIGWRHFAKDTWRAPLFWVPTLGYPEGTNIVFTDSIPLAALAAKVCFTLTGLEINYLGAWMGLCYVMQGIAAALVLIALGVHGRIANLSGVLIALSAPILLARFGHGALCAHFLILLSLVMYFRLVERPARPAEWMLIVAAPAAALLVTSYLAVMLAAIGGATVLESGRRRLVPYQVSAGICLAIPLVAIVTMIIAGMIGPNAPSPEGGGYGRFSMNLLAPLFGDAWSYTQRLVGPITVDATGGQYEGFSYLGIGVLGLAVTCMLTAPREPWAGMRRHPVLTATLVLLSLYALGNVFFVGATEVWRFEPPGAFVRFAGAFRSSGRFFWPAYYTITLGLIACIVSRFPGRGGATLVVIAALAQLVEAEPRWASVRAAATSVNAAHFVTPEVADLASRAQRFFVFPSYECTQDDPDWPHPESWRAAIVELTLATSERALPTNSAYVNRGRKDCTEEQRALAHRPFEPATLYVVRRRDAPEFASAFGDAGTCHTTDAAFLCLAEH